MPKVNLRLPILLSITAALLTLGLKTLAYVLTGSVGMLSEAAESSVNLIAALTALFSLWYSSLPVDPTHTYGHEKIEFFSSGIEGLLVFLAAGGIGWFSVYRLFVPGPLEAIGTGVLVGGVAALINFGVAQHLLRTGRAHRSIVLEAAGRHLMTDVWTTVGVLAGLLLVRATGLHVLDPLTALLVAGHILWTGLDLMRQSFDGLMDHALPVAEQADVRRAIESSINPEMTYHAFRTRQSGSRRFVDFHLLVPGVLSVRDAHEVACQIERAIWAVFPGTEVTIHVEPIEDSDSWTDSELLAVERSGVRPPAAGG